MLSFTYNKLIKIKSDSIYTYQLGKANIIDNTKCNRDLEIWESHMLEVLTLKYTV